MTDDTPTPIEAVRSQLYRALRGSKAARDDPAMAALSLEVGILEAIAALDAILSPPPALSATTRQPGKGGASRGPGACREARVRKAASVARDVPGA